MGADDNEIVVGDWVGGRYVGVPYVGRVIQYSPPSNEFLMGEYYVRMLIQHWKYPEVYYFHNEWWEQQFIHPHIPTEEELQTWALTVMKE